MYAVLDALFVFTLLVIFVSAENRNNLPITIGGGIILLVAWSAWLTWTFWWLPNQPDASDKDVALSE